MKFSVTLVDPPSYRFAHVLTDICRTIVYGLRDLGHDCDLILNSLDNSATNIIVGTHLLTAADVAGIIQARVPYIALQSEALYRDPTTGAISSSYNGPQFEEVARPLMDHAQAVWDGLTDLRILYQLSVADEKVKRFRIGYCEGLEDIDHRPYPRKDIDVLFFGGLTPYRQEIIGKLNGMRVQVFQYGPSAFRNDLIARTKLNLSLHSAAELDYFQQTRGGYLLNNRGLVVAEPSIDHPPMRDLVVETTSALLRKSCAQLLANPAEIERRAQAGYEGYRDMPMSDVLAEIL